MAVYTLNLGYETAINTFVPVGVLVVSAENDEQAIEQAGSILSAARVVIHRQDETTNNLIHVTELTINDEEENGE